MAFEGLTEKLTSVFNKLRGKGHLSGHAGNPPGSVGGGRQL